MWRGRRAPVAPCGPGQRSSFSAGRTALSTAGAACPEGPCSFGVCTCPALGPSLRVGVQGYEVCCSPGPAPSEASSPFPSGQEEPSSLGPQNQQGAEERELEEPGEQEKQVPEVQEALKQEQEAKALAAARENNREKEKLRQENER